MKKDTMIMVAAVAVLAFVFYKTMKKPALHQDPATLTEDERYNMGLYGV